MEANAMDDDWNRMEFMSQGRTKGGRPQSFKHDEVYDLKL